MKQCRKCREVKNLEDFHRAARLPDGLQIYCKRCSIRASAAWNSANKERRARTLASWQRANKGRIAKTSAAWNSANKERRAQTRAAWQKANPEALKLSKHLRRQREQNGISPEDRIAALAYMKALRGDPCRYCGDKPATMHVDHIVPLALGGTNHWTNLAAACPSCNSSKGPRCPAAWCGLPCVEHCPTCYPDPKQSSISKRRASRRSLEASTEPTSPPPATAL